MEANREFGQGGVLLAEPKVEFYRYLGNYLNSLPVFPHFITHLFY